MSPGPGNGVRSSRVVRGMIPRQTIAVAAAAALAVLALTGCSAQLGDRTGGSGRDPDKLSDVDYVEVYRNIDNFPNIAKVCVGGVAFAATSTRDGQTSPSLVRVPEWDASCPRTTPTAPAPTATGSGG